jgi:hypothetical protein
MHVVIDKFDLYLEKNSNEKTNTNKNQDEPNGVAVTSLDSYAGDSLFNSRLSGLKPFIFSVPPVKSAGTIFFQIFSKLPSFIRIFDSVSVYSSCWQLC